MLIYKQRYKPRTTREFTKSDLTVYDSAGNTALNALTVYGKSEVVDGAIKSAGEGFVVVDLGALDWAYNSASRIFTSNSVTNSKRYPVSTPVYYICSRYKSIAHFINADANNKCLVLNTEYHGVNTLIVCDTDYTDPTAFKTAMTGVLLCYELADPTQGNCIAVKTDNGSGIDGTMAVFETGTPLYGVSDTVRDVMQWNGSAGTVTKNCGEVDLGTLTWSQHPSEQNVYIAYFDTLMGNNGVLCNKYPAEFYTAWASFTADHAMGLLLDTTRTIIRVRDSNLQTLTDFIAHISSVKLVYELATPTTTSLTTTENASIAGLRTFEPTTHAQNNAQTDMTVDYTIRVPTI